MLDLISRPKVYPSSVLTNLTFFNAHKPIIVGLRVCGFTFAGGSTVEKCTFNWAVKPAQVASVKAWNNRNQCTTYVFAFILFARLHSLVVPLLTYSIDTLLTHVMPAISRAHIGTPPALHSAATPPPTSP